MSGKRFGFLNESLEDYNERENKNPEMVRGIRPDPHGKYIIHDEVMDIISPRVGANVVQPIESKKRVCLGGSHLPLLPVVDEDIHTILPKHHLVVFLPNPKTMVGFSIFYLNRSIEKN